MEKVTFFGEAQGISMEHMVRDTRFDMRVKHFHSQYEIFYILEGERLFFFDNREYLAKPGDLILVNSNLIHMTRSLPGTDRGHNRIILYITKEKISAFDSLYPALQLTSFFNNFYGLYHLDEEQKCLFLNLYHHFRHMFAKKERNYKLGIELETVSYLFKLMSYVQSQEQALPHFSDNPKYQTAYAVADYLSEHCEQPVSLEELSARFFLSKSYICRIFKEITGYNIKEYANIHRIKKAKRLLEETDKSISDIAHMLGFESLTYFERVFKTYATIPPLKYRKTLNTITYKNESFTLSDSEPPEARLTEPEQK